MTHGGLKITVALLCAALLGGCVVAGPRALEGGRAEYNDAIKTTEVEQILLNIVRLRFNDRPYVLEVSSISSRVEVGARAGAAAAAADSSPFDSGVQAGGRVTYYENPTIVYLPLKGKDFVRQLMTPIALNTLLLLRQSGWELDDIFRVFVESINGVPNASTGASSTPEGVPEYAKFLRVANAFDAIEDLGSVKMARSRDSEPQLVLIIRPESKKTPEFKELAELLNLNPDSRTYRIRLGLDQGGDQDIVISTRSILAAMFFVGQSIEFSNAMRETGTIHVNYDLHGRPFDWQLVHDDLIQIKMSDSRPRGAYAAVRYHDNWYYIENTDIDSKETLTMLGMVFTLSAGGDSSQSPVLTIPVD